MGNAAKQLSWQNAHRFIRKSNSLVEASYKLTTNEQRVILLLCTAIKPEDENFQAYRIRIKEFADLVGLKNKNIYAEVEKLVVALREKTLKITTPQSVLHIGWLSSIEYFSGEGIIELCFDPKLKPFLLDLQKRFTSYRLKQVIQLKSSFSIRIYELLKQYESLGERVIELDRLKEILGIHDQSYNLYGNFKRKVLLVAQREISKKTDLQFEFKEEKDGRKVIKLKFLIKPNEAAESRLKAEAVEEKAAEALGTLTAMLPDRYQRQMSIRRLISAMLKKEGFEYVARNIEYANAKSNAVNNGRSLGKGSNYRSYLAIALRGDFGLPFKEDLEAAKSNQVVNLQKEAELAKVQQEQMERSRLDKQNMDRARIYLENLPPEARDQLREEAFESLNPQEKSLVLRKTPGAEILLKIAMTRICLTRMHISQPDLIEKDVSA